MRRVLHAPIEIAGQMGELCRGLRSMGWVANGYNWFHTYLQYRSPIVHTDAYELLQVFDPIVRSVDLVHFHNGDTMLAEYRDLPMLKSLGVRMIMHHWGNDVRDIEVVNRRQKYLLPPGYQTSDEIQQKMTVLAQYIDHAIIQDHELYEFVAPYYRRVHILPLAIDAAALQPVYPDPTKRCPLVVHAPTSDEFKGTKYVEAAIDKLRGKLPFEYKRIEKMNHNTALAWYAQADIVVDQVLCGSYGLLSVEAMALGKPVVTYIRDDLRATYPGQVPIVSANPDSLEYALGALIASPELRATLGKQGRRYVEQYHDTRVVVRQLIKIYQEVLGE